MTEAGTRLAALAERVRRDLDAIAHPRQPWLEPRIGPDGQQALDVLVVGAGQSGLATAFGLARAKVTNVLVIDRAEPGREGPWRTYARMKTLRSPKDFTGPDLDVPSLTYQSWHEARFGEADWTTLDLIPREYWADYLDWYRDVLALPVRNRTTLVDIAPAGELLAATLESADGGRETVHARKIVLATGQEGAGRWAAPPELAGLPAGLLARTPDAIDFGRLAGRTVAVIGAGASALDNAATALEAGATVHLLCRRAVAQVVQPYRFITFVGFLRHLGDLDDAWRWRFMEAVLAMREGFPQATWDRCARHATFHLHEGSPVLAARESDGRAILVTPSGPIEADLVIAATGTDIDYASRPELARFAENIATWGDRYTPPDGPGDPRLAAFPYLADNFAFTEREAGRTPWTAGIHLFAIAATMSHGPSGSSINAMTTAVPKLVSGLTRDLFRADIERHWSAFQAYDVPQAVLRRPARS